MESATPLHRISRNDSRGQPSPHSGILHNINVQHTFEYGAACRKIEITLRRAPPQFQSPFIFFKYEWQYERFCNLLLKLDIGYLAMGDGIDQTAAAPLSRSAAIGLEIKLEIAKRRISRKRLIEETGLSASTVNKALTGTFSQATLARIENAIGCTFPLRAVNGKAVAVHDAPRSASIKLGGYLKQAVDDYIGDYLTLRPSFSKPGAVFSYQTTISWNEEHGCLYFEEKQRPDSVYAQRGCILIPVSSMFIYLVSALDKGWHRAITVSTLNGDGEMRGIITTLAHIKGAHFVPISAPIFYRKICATLKVSYGVIDAMSPNYESYHSFLKSVTADEHAKFAMLESEPR